MGWGLDIPQVTSMINYHSPSDINSYVHCIGLISRTGQQSSVLTILTEEDFEIAGPLLEVLRHAGQRVPPQLEELARMRKS